MVLNNNKKIKATALENVMSLGLQTDTATTLIILKSVAGMGATAVVQPVLVMIMIVEQMQIGLRVIQSV